MGFVDGNPPSRCEQPKQIAALQLVMIDRMPLLLLLRTRWHGPQSQVWCRHTVAFVCLSDSISFPPPLLRRSLRVCSLRVADLSRAFSMAPSRIKITWFCGSHRQRPSFAATDGRRSLNLILLAARHRYNPFRAAERTKMQASCLSPRISVAVRQHALSRTDSLPRSC